MTKAQAAVQTIMAVADAIKELGSVPSGRLYANLVGVMELSTYQTIIGILKNTKLITESGNVLSWVGPTT